MLALEVHAQPEEEIVYPALRRLDLESTVIGKSVREHDGMRRLIGKTARHAARWRAAASS